MTRVPTHKTETESRLILEYTLSTFTGERVERGDLLFRVISERDYGIDGEIELFSHGEPIGRFAKVQIKGTEKQIEKLKEEDFVSCSGISKSNLKYCQQNSLPVILVYCSTLEKRFYYIDLQSVYRKMISECRGKKSGTVHIPIANNSDNLEILVDIINSYYERNELTHQIFCIADFIKAYDNNSMNAPLDAPFYHRKEEFDRVSASIGNNFITIISGASGTGKTRLALEVCRKYETEGWNVCCVKSNGRLLYNDIAYYLGQQSRCLLFFDDANTVSSLDNILSYIISCDESDIRVLMTVRDYAKKGVIQASKIYQSNSIEIGVFSNDEIQEILKNNYNIQNYDYLARIVQVAKGNIRLAAMAAIRAVDAGFPAIVNAEDIFRVYYSPVFEKAQLTREEMVLLCIIAITGPVRMKSAWLYQHLCEKYLYNSEIDTMLERLCDLEFVDWFKSELIKISDQSFGNYILYHVVFEKKWIDFGSLIAESFPSYKNRIIYSLNTLCNLFMSEEMGQFISNTVNYAWDLADQKNQLDYVESFYRVNPVKGLAYLKTYVINLPSVDFDLKAFDFQKESSYRHIRNKEIEILAGYSKTQHFETAAELLLILYDKRPDLIMDFYFAITDRIFDKYSISTSFQAEHLLVDKLLERIHSGDNYNFSYLFIHVADKFLICESNYTESAAGRSITMVTMGLPASQEIRMLRHKVIEALLEMYNDSRYHSDVVAVLRGQSYHGSNREAALELCLSDFDRVLKFFIGKGTVGFEDSLVIDNYRKALLAMGATIDERFSILNNSFEYTIYDLLTKEHIRGRTIEEDEKERRDQISQAITSYDMNDYDRMFSACKKIEELENRVEWSLGTGIAILFDLLEDTAVFSETVKRYFIAGAPVYRHQNKLINTIISKFGYDYTKELLYKAPESIRDDLMGMVFESISEENVTRSIVQHYHEFQKNQLVQEKPIILNLKDSMKFLRSDDSLLDEISEKLINTPNRIGWFFSYAANEKSVKLIGDAYKNRLDTLQKMYFSCNASHFDHHGKLFELLFVYNPDEVWHRFVQKHKNNYHDYHDSKIFGIIWKKHYRYEYIDYAFTELVDDAYLFSDEIAGMIFDSSKDDPEEEIKKAWLIEKINKDYSNTETINNIISTAAVLYPEFKNSLVLQYLELEKTIDAFKKLYLFPLAYTVVGSEIPIITSRIKELEELDKAITGAEYIEHKVYLQKRIRSLQKQKEEVEISEYLENEM